MIAHSCIKWRLTPWGSQMSVQRFLVIPLMTFFLGLNQSGEPDGILSLPIRSPSGSRAINV